MVFVGELRPIGEAVAVGVAGLGKISPILANSLGERDVAVALIDVLEHKIDILTVVRTVGIGGRLVKIIDIDLALAYLRLQRRPSPSLPTKCSVAHKVAGGLVEHLLRAKRIGSKQFVGKFAITVFDDTGVVFVIVAPEL